MAASTTREEGRRVQLSMAGAVQCRLLAKSSFFTYFNNRHEQARPHQYDLAATTTFPRLFASFFGTVSQPSETLSVHAVFYAVAAWSRLRTTSAYQGNLALSETCPNISLAIINKGTHGLILGH